MLTWIFNSIPHNLILICANSLMVAPQNLICTKAASVDSGVTPSIRPTRDEKDLDYRVVCRVPGEWETVA